MKKILWLLVLIPLLSLAQGKPIIDGIKLIPQGAPGSPIEGELYYDDTSNTIFVWDGSAWLDLSAGGGGSQDLASVLTQGADASSTAITGLGNMTFSAGGTFTFDINGSTLELGGGEITNGGQAGFTTLSASTLFVVPNLSSSGSNAGAVYLDTDDNKFYGYNGSAFVALDEGTGLQNIVEDTTPQLGGQLDGQGNNISNAGTVTGATANFQKINIDSGGANSFLDFANSSGSSYAPGLGEGAIYFIDDAMRIATTDASTENPDLEINTGALTVARDLTFTDGDVTYNGTSLTSGGSGLTTDQTNRLANSGLPPKTLLKNADFILASDDMRMETSGNADIGRAYLMTVNDGGTTIATFEDVGSTDDVGRIKTMTNSDIFEAHPGTGVTLDWEGKTGSENSIRVNGKGHLAWFQKTSANNYFFYGDIVGFDNIGDAIVGAGAIHYWTPESVQGGTVDGDAITGWNDTVGSLNGTVSGSVTLNLDGAEREVEFDGGYIDFADVASVDFDNQTDEYSIVIKTGTVTNTTGYMVSKHNGSTAQYGVLNGSSNDLQGNVGGTGGAGLTFSHTGNDLFILTVNTSTWNLYANGVLVDSAVSVGAGQASGQSLNFGSRTDGGFLFDGSLERVAIFDKELTTEEINEIELQFQEN